MESPKRYTLKLLVAGKSELTLGSRGVKVGFQTENAGAVKPLHPRITLPF